MGVTDLFRVQELKDNLAAKQKEADELRRKVAELSESLNQASQQKNTCYKKFPDKLKSALI